MWKIGIRYGLNQAGFILKGKTDMNKIPEASFLRIWQITGDRRRGLPPIIPVSKATWWQWVACLIFTSLSLFVGIFPLYHVVIERIPSEHAKYRQTDGIWTI
jgi:hypothetical protein